MFGFQKHDHNNHLGKNGHPQDVVAPGEHHHAKGKQLLHEPGLNKFTSFSSDERDATDTRGLLPYAVEDFEKQARREMNMVRKKQQPIEKYMHLQGLLDRNPRLFYKVVIDNVEEIMPLVYTPTVGEACIRYSELTQYCQGLYISLDDAGHVEQILRNWGEPNVRAIVVTDGERILGLGDLGANGMGIPVGKLQLYVACGGIHPSQTLPITIDVGTNNEKLRNDEFYIGMRRPRERGKKYDELIEEFVHSVNKVFGPNCLIQWEDFGNSTAFHILQKYRDTHLSFNDDIQGTASVTLAAMFSSLRITAPAGGPKNLASHVFCFLGAGEAGVGIADLISDSIAREMKWTKEESRKNIWLVDSTGLVCKERTDALAHHKLLYAHSLTAEMKAAFGFNKDGSQGLGEINNLEKVVSVLQATALIGVSAQPQTFTEKVCLAMVKNTSRPVIFALSNPTDKAECTAEQAINWTDGKCIFASGSPFAPVARPDGTTVKIAQANNSYIFNGLALGVLSVQVKMIPDELLEVAAKSLADQATDEDLKSGSLLPPITKIREISAKIARDVAFRSYELGIAKLIKPVGDLLEFIKAQMYVPSYEPTTTQHKN